MDALNKLFMHTNTSLENAFSRMEQQVPAPQRVKWGDDGFVFRYVEQTIEQAIVLKLARIVTGLYSAILLHRNGFFQEQGVLQRVLDELCEDANFLLYAVIRNEVTDLHKRYLAAFFEEEFDAARPTIDAPQKRPMIKRQNIRSYLTDVDAQGLSSMGQKANPAEIGKPSRTLSKAYSGFVHAAAPHVMDMYGGRPPKFYTRGMLGTPRELECAADLWNYFFRAILAFTLAARAFGDRECDEFLVGMRKEFEAASHEILGDG